MATPKGSPPWEHTAGIADYGGHTEKHNYLSIGPINPLTDVTAEAIMRMAQDLVCVTNTAAFAELTMQQDDSTPDDPTVTSARIMTAVATSSYAGDSPPTGFPTCIRQSDGVVRITFSSSYNDAYGVSGDLAIVAVVPSVCGSTAAYCTWESINDYTIDINTWDAAGAAETDQKITVIVY